MSITEPKNKKTIIIALFGFIILVLIAVIFVPGWLEKRNDTSLNDTSLNSEEPYQTRAMEQDEKLRYQINPESEVDVIKDSEGDFIYQIKK